MENVHELSSPEQSLKSARLREVERPSESPGASKETDQGPNDFSHFF